jgi:alpha-tubulin suppressor-like RCC1 family protein
VGGPVAAVAAGGYHTCAVLMDGAVRCWGKGESGQLGYANTNSVGDDESPASMGTVDVGGAVAEITAGNVHTCARLTTGAVRCWGEGVFGQHGYARASPVGDDESPASMGDVDLGEPAVHVASGGLHNCALLASGAVRCWGFGEHGQLGNGRAVTIGDDESPASAGVVTVGGQVKKLGCGYRHSCALLTSGTVRCWGSADSGRLGYPGVADPIGDDESPASAGDVPLGELAVDLEVGSDHNCALLETGAVRCWGFAGQGKLGYGNLNDIGDDEPPANMGDVVLGGAAVQITAGLRHTCALLTSGAVRCWGAFDPLGYGNTNNIGDDEFPADAGDVPLL